MPFEVLEVRQSTSQAFLKVDKRCVSCIPMAFSRLAWRQLQYHGMDACRDLQKVWAAVTLLTSYDGNLCQIEVRRSPPSGPGCHNSRLLLCAPVGDSSMPRRTICHAQVEAASPFLASLAVDSRAFAAQLPFIAR